MNQFTMNHFNKAVLLIDRADINTDEIIPAKYLTEISKKALGPHLFEDLKDNKMYYYDNDFRGRIGAAGVIVTRSNFGCGSSREHAVWAIEVNDIKIVIAPSFARIFRQNMFNCGILAIELSEEDIEELFVIACKDEHSNDPRGMLDCKEIDLENSTITFNHWSGEKSYPFKINEFDRELVAAGGWLAYANQKY